MKKIIKALLVVMVLVLALTACNLVPTEPQETPDVPACTEHTGGTATCSKQAICEVCGERYGEKAEHKPVEIPAVAPTCLSVGFTAGTKCSECGLVLEAQQKLEKGGHNMVDVPEMAPTCGVAGYTAHQKCSACGLVDEAYAEIEPTGDHSFTVEVEAKTPTCLEDGWTAHLACDVCGAPNEDYELFVAGDEYHSFPEELQFYVTAPTCTTTGVLAGYCEYCEAGYYLDKNVPALGHKDEDGDGVCDVCEEEMPVVHEHEWTDATCVAPKTCATCGETEGEALGHTWADATCTVAKTCSVCGETEGEALGHAWVNATCTVAKTCSVCGETEGEALGHDYDHVVTDPTCTAAGYTTHTCAFCDDSYTDTEVDALGHADDNGDYKCDRCSTKMLPADGTALTVEQALAIAQLGGSSYTTQKYYITGIVSGLYNTTYGNFYIKNPETGKEICIYGLYSADGTTRYDAMSYKPVNGDEVTVYTVLGTYNGTAQGKNAWLDEVVAHEHDYTSVVTEATCLKDGYTTHTCSICGDQKVDSTVEALGHTTDNGTCERCGTVVGDNVNTDPVTVSKTMKELITQYGWDGNTVSQSFDLDNVVSVKIKGGANTGKAYNGDHIRLYATDSPAATVTITVPEGYELVSIKITTQTGTYAYLYVNGTTTDICNKTVEVSGTSVVLNSVKNGSDGKQVRVTGIEVTYQPVVE